MPGAAMRCAGRRPTPSRSAAEAGTVPMSVGAEIMTETAPAPAPTARRRTGRRVAALLAAPGALWMIAFLVVPIAMMVYVSFWTQKTFTIEPTLTLQNWASFFGTSTYLSALWTTMPSVPVVDSLCHCCCQPSKPVGKSDTKVSASARSPPQATIGAITTAPTIFE